MSIYPHIIYNLKQVILKGEKLEDAFAKSKLDDHPERAYIKEVCYGVCRFYLQLEETVSGLVFKPLRKKDWTLRLLLYAALYQIIHCRKPDYVVVSEAVKSTKTLKIGWAKNLVNALLRTFCRTKDKKEALYYAQSNASHPPWMVQCLQQSWPQHYQDILRLNNEKAPFTLRVNTQKISRIDYLSELRNNGYEVTPCAFSTVGIELAKPCLVTDLLHFSDGAVSVQDQAAQLAAPLLSVARNDKVLDVCSAPGGKSCHLLEIEPTISLHCLDSEAKRLLKVVDNCKRLALPLPKISVVDATDLSPLGFDQDYDKILIDAPCSALGVIRRHPDIKILRMKVHIERLLVTQQQILNESWRVLKKLGTLLYCTCSVLNEENDAQLQQFLNAHKDAQIVPLDVTWGRATQYGRQIFPGDDNMDGFYYAKLQKKI